MGKSRKIGRRKIAENVIQQVLLQSKRRCALCHHFHGDDQPKMGQIAHLDADPSNQSPDNLVYLCLKHHDEYDRVSGVGTGLRAAEVKSARAELYKVMATGPPSVKEGCNVFLSYSHPDSAIAKHLALELEAAGVTCFMAQKDIAAGEVWEAKIRKTIQEADRVLLLITPRSKNSLWVAAEAGAAWALEKDLIAAIMFVEPSELIDPIKRHQARSIETPEQIAALINELAPSRTFPTDRIDGQWIDPSDKDTVFFKQVGSRIVGFYDLGSGKKKVGVYLGSLEKRQLNYQWRWLNGQFEGHGQMVLSTDGKTLKGKWWYGGRKDETQCVEYRRVSDEMPSWLSSDDFAEYSYHFKKP